MLVNTDDSDCLSNGKINHSVGITDALVLLTLSFVRNLIHCVIFYFQAIGTFFFSQPVATLITVQLILFVWFLDDLS